MAILVFIRLHPLLGSLVTALNENGKCGLENWIKTNRIMEKKIEHQKKKIAGTNVKVDGHSRRLPASNEIPVISMTVLRIASAMQVS